jgi:uncharacterized membrane protein
MKTWHRIGFFIGAAIATLALLGLVLAMHPDLGVAGSEASWAPVGFAGLFTIRGALAFALAALAAVLLVLGMSPDRGDAPASFFALDEKSAISHAIASAENRTSGEIRVHVARDSRGRPRSAAEVSFVALGMHATAARNGVLIYISVADHCFAIIGDKGIDRVVPTGFWDDVTAEMQGHFGRRQFAAGTIAAVLRIGQKLHEFFPRERGDVNELSNEISTE